MNIEEMSLQDIAERRTAIEAEMITEGADLDALEAEVRSLAERESALKQAAEERAALEAEIMTAPVVEEITESIKEDSIMENRITVASPEYRDAFYRFITNPGETEARATLLGVDSSTVTGAGEAIAIPKTLDEKIWDNIHTNHPILADITTIASGIALEVTKHTAIAARVAGKKDKADNAGAEDNTFVKVVLYGVDYEKYVELTYAEAKMSQGALEDYLAQEIAAELGEALAKDVFAQIKSDAGAAQTLGGSVPTFAEVASLLGAADHAIAPVIYCSAANYYAMFGQVDSNGQPVFRDGVAIGAQVKIDSAAGTNYICVDPAKFVLNEVSGVVIESERDVKNHHVIVAGYMRAQGCMRDNKAAAWF